MRPIGCPGSVLFGVVVLPVVVPNSNDTFADAPRSLTDPESVADESVMADAVPVVSGPG
jgi:hypothetical protein